MQIRDGIRYYSSFFFMREISSRTSSEIDEMSFFWTDSETEMDFFESLLAVIAFDLDWIF